MSPTTTTTTVELLNPVRADASAQLPFPEQYPIRLDANEAPPLLPSLARERLAEMPRTRASRSDSNMLWLRTERLAVEVFAALLVQRILVRSFAEQDTGLHHQLRVTIGAPEENDAFLSAPVQVT